MLNAVQLEHYNFLIRSSDRPVHVRMVWVRASWRRNLSARARQSRSRRSSPGPASMLSTATPTATRPRDTRFRLRSSSRSCQWHQSNCLRGYARLVRVLQTALANSRSFAWRILEACSQQKPVACRRDFRTNSMGSTSTRWPSMSKGGRVTMICAGLSWGNCASMP